MILYPHFANISQVAGELAVYITHTSWDIAHTSWDIAHGCFF